jgi:hypothetical protein
MLTSSKDRWPSWLWRQVKVTLTSLFHSEVSWSRKWRGFESHSVHLVAAVNSCNTIPFVRRTMNSFWAVSLGWLWKRAQRVDERRGSTRDASFCFAFVVDGRGLTALKQHV